MDSKLAEYRARKRRTEAITKIKGKLVKMLPFAGQESEKEKEDSFVVPLVASELTDSLTDLETISDLLSDTDTLDEEEIPDDRSLCMKYTLYVVYFCFWATCFAIAVELKFGIVYLLFSGLFGIYFNTRTGPKRRKEISAYSVFNEGCHAIDGTLKAEQFENEIRYGSASVR